MGLSCICSGSTTSWSSTKLFVFENWSTPVLKAGSSDSLKFEIKLGSLKNFTEKSVLLSLRLKLRKQANAPKKERIKEFDGNDGPWRKGGLKTKSATNHKRRLNVEKNNNNKIKSLLDLSLYV